GCDTSLDNVLLLGQYFSLNLQHSVINFISAIIASVNFLPSSNSILDQSRGWL
ncbi:10985_t:CDS:2, partial [Funneliformis geosporum]